MGVLIAEETMVFLQACVLGVALGACYDVFRVMRMAVKMPKMVIAILDLLYFAILIVAGFSFVMSFHNGSLRIFILFGEAVGGILYFCTLSVLVIKIVRKIIWLVYRILGWLFHIFVAPVLWVFKKMVLCFARLAKFVTKKLKKYMEKLVLYLKSLPRLVYNKRTAEKSNQKQVTKKKAGVKCLQKKQRKAK